MTQLYAQPATGDPVIPTDPNVDFYLSLPGIPGESDAKGFANQIPLLTWAWGVTSPTSIGTAGGGAGAGRPVPEKFVFAATTGIQSPKILTAVNTGLNLQKALLSCVRPGGRAQFTFLTLELQDVRLTSYEVTPHHSTAQPMDVVSLVFTKVTYRVTEQDRDGSTGQTVESTFDYRTNSV